MSVGEKTRWTLGAVLGLKWGKGWGDGKREREEGLRREEEEKVLCVCIRDIHGVGI